MSALLRINPVYRSGTCIKAVWVAMFWHVWLGKR